MLIIRDIKEFLSDLVFPNEVATPFRLAMTAYTFILNYLLSEVVHLFAVSEV